MEHIVIVQHTPGPWTAFRHGEVRGPNAVTVAAAYTPANEPRGARVPVRQANARLIAAAPDLFVALGALLAAAREAPEDVREQARAALAKALSAAPGAGDGA